MFLKSTDFIGFYQISKPNSHSIGNLQSYIDLVEPNILRDLLGNNLYALFIADLDPNFVPQSQRFIDIFNAFNIDSSSHSNSQHRSSGIKEMLKGFVYFNYVRDSDFFNTISGNVKNTFSNSNSVSSPQYGLNERHNVALSSYYEIQWFICENDSIYPEFNGINKNLEIWL